MAVELGGQASELQPEQAGGNEQGPVGPCERLAEDLHGTAVRVGGALEVARECDLVLEGEVDHAIGLLRATAQHVEVVEGAAQRLGARAAKSIGGGIRASEPDDLVVGAEELGNHRRADPARRTGNEYAHQRNLRLVGRRGSICPRRRRDVSCCHHRSSRCQSLPSFTIWGMGRWQPDARGRLAKAAMELYAERGFDQTTVAEIAERAGLTERTFYRHFEDKREVLFAGAGELEELIVNAVVQAPGGLAPIEAAAAGLQAAAGAIEQGGELPRQRQAVIAASSELQERELIKLASLGAALAGALRQRGVDEPAASLAAEASIAVFRVAFERWIADVDGQDLQPLIRDSLDELRAVTARR